MKKILSILLTMMLCCSFTSIVIEDAANFTEPQKARLFVVAANLEKVINSVEFKADVLNHTYAGKKTFVDNGRNSNESIYKIIMDGREELVAETDNKWNIRYKLGPLGSSVVAQTNAARRDVTINEDKFDEMVDSQLAKTICHEQLHKLGFNHDFNNNSSRPYSVPYGCGSICMTLYQTQIFNDAHLIPKYRCGIWCKFKKIFY